MTIKLFYDETNTFELTNQQTPGECNFYFFLPSIAENPVENGTAWLDAIKGLKELIARNDDEIYCYIYLMDINDAELLLTWFPEQQIDFVYIANNQNCPLHWSKRWKSWHLYDLSQDTWFSIDKNGIISSGVLSTT